MIIRESELKKLVERAVDRREAESSFAKRELHESLFYGNPTRDQLEMMKQSPLLNEALASGILKDYFAKGPGPKPTSEELWKMAREMREVDQAELAYIKACEEDRHGMLAEHLRSIGLGFYTKDAILKMVAPYQGILHYAKHAFNTPRPWALAYDLGIPLFPLISTDASSASTPGGHAFDSGIVALLVSNNHPELGGEIWRLAHSVAHTRVRAGLHYLGDNMNALELIRCLVMGGLI